MQKKLSQPQLDLETARRYVAEIIEEMGEDFVYASPSSRKKCSNIPLSEAYETGWFTPGPEILSEYKNTTSWTTGCLVGRVLDRHGFSEHRSEIMWFTPVSCLRPLLSSHDVEVYLLIIQNNQDNGESWGQARDKAEAWITARETTSEVLPGAAGVAYPHPGCPAHDPDAACGCGNPDRCLSPTHGQITMGEALEIRHRQAATNRSAQ